MGAVRGYYSLIQYCPDPSRAECANVGVVLFCPEVRFIEARTATGNDRARRFFGTDSFDPSRLRTAKRAIEDRIRVSRDDFRTLEDLNTFIQTRANELQLTVPRPVKVMETPEAELETLFQELVGGRSRKGGPRPEFPELDRALRAPSLENRIQFNLQIEIPVLERQLRVPYAYQNGSLNLVKPQKFSGTKDRVAEVAMRLAIEGDLLHHHKGEESKRQLIVIPSFGNNQSDTAQELIRNILGEYHTRTVLPADIDAFVQEVEREAH